jgi:crossover junction endodeoxyribonuclease RuvC
MVKILGLDPGLRRTGWGVVLVEGNALSHIAAGVVCSSDGDDLATRLAQLHRGVREVIDLWLPDQAAIEETFVNKNPTSTLKLGQARGAVMLAASLSGLPVAEYTPNAVKKAVVGSGHADKDQVGMMVRTLLRGAKVTQADAADALAVAICHAHHRGTHDRVLAGMLTQ